MSEVIAPCILNFGTRRRVVLSFTPPAAVPSGKYPLTPRVGGCVDPESVWIFWITECYLRPILTKIRTCRQIAIKILSM